MRSVPRFALSTLAAVAVLTVGAMAPPPIWAAADSTMAVPSAAVPGQAGEVWSLARCIQTALESNGDVRGANARTMQARGGALSAWSNVLPSVTASAGITRINPQGTVNPVDVSSISGSLQTNLLDIRAWSDKRRQDHLRTSARHGEAETRNDVVFRVKQQYFECIKAKRLAEVARDSERLARDEETRSEALFQVGSVARGDVLKARARRASTQLSRIQAVNQVNIQLQRLKQLLGVEIGTSLYVEAEMDGETALPDSASVVAQAIRSRPLLASAQASERAARSGLFGARTSRAPRVTGTANVERTRIEESPASTEWTGALRVSVPLFDGLATEGNVRAAKGSLLESEASRRQLELDVAVETQQAWLLLKEAVERIAVAREGVASAEEDHKFSKSRYELGAGTYLDLLTAAVGLEQARQQLVEAQADARVAEAALERAIGERRY
ncbi:MAG: TolC family protein [Candidatus Eisenbacteria bacterium]